MQRVLFITSTRIGDAIINSGVLDHLVRTRPQARFTIACGPLAASLFTETPRLDRIIVMRKKKAGLHWWDLWCRTVGTKWDLVVDLRSSVTGCFLRAGQRRILKKSKTPIPKVAEAASVLALDPPPDPRLYLSEAVRAQAADRLPGDGPYLAICPSASWIFKVWPAESFAAFIRRFTAPGGVMPGASVVMLGGPGDAVYAQPVFDALPQTRFIDLVGLGLPETAACLQRCRLYVGNDSGLMHMAAAVGTPTLGLFGPSDDRCYAPWGGHTDAVRGPASFAEIDGAHDDRRQHPESLLADLTVDTVYDAAKALFERTA
ncbi:glycosyltransferase family 9 protein [Maricaulis salignorans]|uniref:glycosyltransferase family 9 protein n=1 Tax=Maricaulis salignorans TaxID=144026 RepID=UPI003A8CCFF7